MTASNGETSVRRLASEILLKVDIQKAYADILLDQRIKTQRLQERDRALLTELVYGTLRWAPWQKRIHSLEICCG
ncbi:MAG: Sun protein [Deltaproteobacteria bacterium]|nr:Sun protein [Deltaproteobacteria bacterium]